MLAAASEEANGQVFNLGGDYAINLRNLAEMIVRINGNGKYIVSPFPSERKQIDIGDYYADFNHIHSVLGWEPKVQLEEMLKRTLNYYRLHLDKYI
jgi:nucleoside-diphosphate-sugar epimerase